MGDNINVLALVPIVSADMMQFSIVYRAATLEIIGTRWTPLAISRHPVKGA